MLAFNRRDGEETLRISLREGCAAIVAWWEKEAPAVDPEKDSLEDALAAAHEKFAAGVSGLYTQ